MSGFGREVRRYGGGVRAEVVRGRRAGPSLWVWVPAGAKAPSMVQAAAELRDRLDPARLGGSVGFLLDGPLVRDEPRADASAAVAAVREATAGATAVVALVEGPGEQAPRVELDLDDEAARSAARATGVPLLVKAPRERARLAAPLLTFVDGSERGRPAIDRPARARAAAALASLASRWKLLPRDEPAHAPSLRAGRIVLRTRVSVGRGDEAGSAEVLAAAGDVVHAGDVLAVVGAPGLARSPIVSPVAGVVLAIDRSTGGPSIVLGKLDKTLARAERLFGRPPPERRRLAIGWCEWVALPELGVARIKAKVDTGARTCALHVVSLRPAGDDAQGRPLLDVEIPAGRAGRTVRARCAVVEHASVRDSGGHLERRPVVETTLALGAIERRVRVGLTHRGDMLFPMLIGRTALGADLLVDPSARFLLGRKLAR